MSSHFQTVTATGKDFKEATENLAAKFNELINNNVDYTVSEPFTDTFSNEKGEIITQITILIRVTDSSSSS